MRLTSPCTGDAVAGTIGASWPSPATQAADAHSTSAATYGLPASYLPPPLARQLRRYTLTVQSAIEATMKDPGGLSPGR